MVQEVRYLAFDTSEVETAVRDLAAKLRTPLPAGRLRHMQLASEHCSLTYDGGEYRLTPSGLYAALALFCRSRQIPLPQRQHKRLDIVDGHVALVIGDRDDLMPADAVLGLEALPVG